MNMTKKTRPAAITLTDNAKNQLLNMLKSAPADTIGVRLGLKNSGCAGMSYIMDFISDITPSDEIIDCNDFKIAIELKSLLFLLGTRMDYKTDKMRAGFIFENPNQTDACGCGESVKLIPAAFDNQV